MNKIIKHTSSWVQLFRGKDTSGIPAPDDTEQKGLDTVYTLGDTSKLLGHSPRVAVIGTRDANQRDIQTVERIIFSIAASGQSPVILSGLALGVDARAHLYALSAGLPTVAVMPTGLDEIYPRMHRELAEKIIDTPGCCLLSQFPEKTAPIAINFLTRNHTIARLADLVVVVASKHKGGAMVTARIARSYDTPALAVPGHPDDTHNKGCNQLIKEGTAQMLADFEELKDIIKTIDTWKP